MIVLNSERTRKSELFSVPIIYTLFTFYMLGSVFAFVLADQCETVFLFAEYRRSFLSDLLKCVICYGAVVLLSKASLGILGIPLALCFRGFIFTATASCLVSADENNLIFTLIQYGVPALIRLPALFYLSAICFALSLRRMRHISLKQDNLRDIKRAILYSVAAVLASAILNDLMSFW